MTFLSRSAGALLILAGLGACAGSSRPERPSPDPQQPEPPRAQAAERLRPRLVLWLTIDQWGANVLERQARHLPGSTLGGWLERGLWYTSARYDHSITETAPGHATLHTGASPRAHGIVANEWYDRPSDSVFVSVQDPQAPLLGPGITGTGVAGLAGTGFASTVDAASGRSPRALLAPTFADALRKAHGDAARVVSISVKDRAAILSAGQAGKAYWLGPRGYLTSRYYHDTAPAWLLDNDSAHPLASYFVEPWKLLSPEHEYLSPPGEAPYAPASLGPTFPHGPRSAADLRTAVARSPLGDRASLDLARAALRAEELGKDDVPDLLAISLSSLDYVGHYYGPESREAEDAFLRLDRELGAFFDFVRTLVDDQRVLLVVSADHGGHERAEFVLPDGRRGRRLAPKQLNEVVRAALDARFGAGRVRARVVSPYVTVEPRSLQESGVQLETALALLTSTLRALPGVYSVLSTAELLGAPSTSAASRPSAESRAPGGAAEDFSARVRESLYPGRSGDLYLIPERDTLLLQEDDLGATHGSPWLYDSAVPIVLLGAGVPAGRVDRPVSVSSLAGTVARLVAVAPPAASSPQLLDEALAP